MQLSAKEIANLLNGQVEGNPDVIVNRPSKIEEGGEGSISFLGNKKYESYVYSTNASIILVSEHFEARQAFNATLIRVENVYKAFALVLEKFDRQFTPEAGISSHAYISPNAKLGQDIYIGEGCVIEDGAHIGDSCILYPQTYIGRNVVLGNKVTLYPGVRIYADCIIGHRCIIHANTVIGSDGFGFAPQSDSLYKKIKHSSTVTTQTSWYR